ncbi:MAG TPA: hypothetical protein VK654_11230 [Nitrospirota bacterium]|nr:hypothetical protein [Nitrospirota bacterium]
MKSMLLYFILLVGMIPLSSFAAEQTQVPATAGLSEKERYEKSAEERLRKVGKELDELKAKAASKSAEARREMRVLLDDAEKKRGAAAAKLEEMRKESAQSWKKVTKDMDRLTDEFERAYEKVKSRFKE